LNNNYIFFRFTNDEVPFTTKFEKALEKYEIEIFVPTFFQLKKHSIKVYIYLFWFLFTKGQYRIIYVKKNNTIIHYTHILPKFFKFPFMRSKDLEIGPAWTDELHRGKDIFPAVITHAVQYFKEDKRIFYIFTNKDNTPSQKAIQKAGFTQWKHGYRTKKLGIYRIKG